MPQIGVLVTTNESPPAGGPPTDTGVAFMVGLADAGSLTVPGKCQSAGDFAALYGPRSATNAVLYDSVDDFFQEGGDEVFIGRVAGPAAAAAALTLQDAGAKPTVVVTALTPGVLGNALFVRVAVAGANYTLTVEDSLANVLETHGPFASASGNAPLLADVSSTRVAFTQSAGTGFTTLAPIATGPTALSGGTDDRTHVVIANYVTALGTFTPDLGPGQVLVPGVTNSVVPGIWSALLTHASVNNRWALMDMDDTATAATLIAGIASIQSSALASYGAFWAGSQVVPGLVPGTSRTVPASAAVSALCARVDSLGNPNRAPAGNKLPLTYATALTKTWAFSDVQALNAAGINVLLNRFGTLENFGMVSPVSPTVDSVYWQANRARCRMALKARCQERGEDFLFDEIDGKGLDIAAFGSAVADECKKLYDVGALYGATPAEAFAVNVGPSVNTATTIANGELHAQASVRISPFAQFVEIDLSAVPVNQSV